MCSSDLEGEVAQSEGSEDGQESVEWDKGTIHARYPKVCNVVKGVNPTTRTRIRSGDIQVALNGESARVVSGRVGGIRKGLLPPFNRGVVGVEFDTSEEVFSRLRNP